MEKKQPTDLPPKYYLYNFQHLAEFVEGMYGNILSDEEIDFLKRFRSLSEDGQCLYLRMANRRYPVFFQSQLQYEELDINEHLWKQLFEAGLASPLHGNHEEYYPYTLNLLNKDELIDFGVEQGESRAGLRAASKAGLLSWAGKEIPYSTFLSYLKEKDETAVVQEASKVYAFLLFLYFGNRYMDMSQFVMRDLQHIRLEDFSEGDFTPYFQTRADAEDKWMMSEFHWEFRLMREETAPEEVASYFERELPKHQELSEVAHRSLDRLLVKIGSWLEQKKLTRQALRFYEKTKRPPARERLVRLLIKQKKKEEALALCQHMLESYQNAEEKYFALDTLNQGDKKRRVKSTTAYLKKAPSCTISSDFQSNVENGALEWYREQGYEGFHCENWLWRGLFGLVFWQVLFDASLDSVHNPFQRMPSDLYHPDFFAKREEKLKKAVEVFQQDDCGLETLKRVFEEKHSIFNPFIAWNDALIDGISLYLQYLTAPQLGEVLLEMARNIREHASGFPDLFVYHDQEEKAKFVEVKSPNDTLSAQQLHWLEFMGELEIDVEVRRVKWTEE